MDYHYHQVINVQCTPCTRGSWVEDTCAGMSNLGPGPLLSGDSLSWHKTLPVRPCWCGGRETTAHQARGEALTGVLPGQQLAGNVTDTHHAGDDKTLGHKVI